MQNFRNILGVMSGTSLDGVDMSICTYYGNDDQWEYELKYAKTFHYEEEWKKDLSDACNLNARDITVLDHRFGKYLGDKINSLVDESGIRPDLIASHGHTVFHEPDKGFSLQIGHGADIAALTGIPVVADFRSADIAKGGQGAPLVPVGDKLLFGEYESCLNLGGIANISFRSNGKLVAGDICPVNMILNYIVEREGYTMDRDGEMGRSGKVIPGLLNELNSLSYYNDSFPKSLGREWFEAKIMNLISSRIESINDILFTVYNHIANQILQIIQKHKINSVLLTGGGTNNKFLLELLSKKLPCKLVVPEKRIIEFKESIIFGFLGFLRMQNIINCYASVTGAESDSVCGVVYL